MSKFLCVTQEIVAESKGDQLIGGKRFRQRDGVALTQHFDDSHGRNLWEYASEQLDQLSTLSSPPLMALGSIGGNSSKEDMLDAPLGAIIGGRAWYYHEAVESHVAILAVIPVQYRVTYCTVPVAEQAILILGLREAERDKLFGGICPCKENRNTVTQRIQRSARLGEGNEGAEEFCESTIVGPPPLVGFALSTSGCAEQNAFNTGQASTTGEARCGSEMVEDHVVTLGASYVRTGDLPESHRDKIILLIQTLKNQFLGRLEASQLFRGKAEPDRLLQVDGLVEADCIIAAQYINDDDRMVARYEETECVDEIFSIEDQQFERRGLRATSDQQRNGFQLSGEVRSVRHRREKQSKRGGHGGIIGPTEWKTRQRTTLISVTWETKRGQLLLAVYIGEGDNRTLSEQGEYVGRSAARHESAEMSYECAVVDCPPCSGACALQLKRTKEHIVQVYPIPVGDEPRRRYEAVEGHTDFVGCAFPRVGSMLATIPRATVVEYFRHLRREEIVLFCPTSPRGLGQGAVVTHPCCRDWGQLGYWFRPLLDEIHLAMLAAEEARKFGVVLGRSRYSCSSADCLALLGEIGELGAWTFFVLQHSGYCWEKKTSLIGCLSAQEGDATARVSTPLLSAAEDDGQLFSVAFVNKLPILDHQRILANAYEMVHIEYGTTLARSKEDGSQMRVIGQVTKFDVVRLCVADKNRFALDQISIGQMVSIGDSSASRHYKRLRSCSNQDIEVQRLVEANFDVNRKTALQSVVKQRMQILDSHLLKCFLQFFLILETPNGALILPARTRNGAFHGDAMRGSRKTGCRIFPASHGKDIGRHDSGSLPFRPIKMAQRRALEHPAATHHSCAVRLLQILRGGSGEAERLELLDGVGPGKRNQRPFAKHGYHVARTSARNESAKKLHDSSILNCPPREYTFSLQLCGTKEHILKMLLVSVGDDAGCHNESVEGHSGFFDAAFARRAA